MSYELVYTHRAEKDIKKLDPSIRRLIAKAHLKLKENPIGYSEKLIMQSEGFRLNLLTRLSERG